MAAHMPGKAFGCTSIPCGLPWASLFKNNPNGTKACAGSSKPEWGKEMAKLEHASCRALVCNLS